MRASTNLGRPIEMEQNISCKNSAVGSTMMDVHLAPSEGTVYTTSQHMQTAIQVPVDVIVKPDMLQILIDQQQQDSPLLDQQPLRKKVYLLLHSTKFMMSVIVLIIFDICLILTELFMELVLLKKGLKMSEHIEMLFLTLSILILGIFMLEVALRIFALGLAFFTHVLELFDASVIIVSFVIDIFTITQSEIDLMAADLIILFRLWRVTRLFTGFIGSLKMQAAIQATESNRLSKEMSEKIFKCDERCLQLQKHVDYLTEILQEANIFYESFRPDSTGIH